MMRTAAALILASLPATSQVFTLTRDQLIEFTAKNPYDRFADGRPKVPNDLLEKVKGLSVEEVWTMLPNAGYANQYEGNWQILHPGQKLVGRAVTAQFMPIRPDVADVVEARAKAAGNQAGGHQRVIDMLQPGDVLVIDLFGKIEGGTVAGDNLATAIWAATGTGFVVDGAIRDLEGIFPMPLQIYFRGTHPSAIRNVMLTGVNIPVRIGNATVMPGDVVFGDRTGVYFIPPQLVKPVVDRAEETHIHDEWTKDKFLKNPGKFKSSELYPTPRDPKLKAEYKEYKKKRLGR
ncbi:MAG: dimethylmenaquinone methyltransferase [Acidobacteria bacterium]|nr:dimethylmenaquinone methyltransferase [Acidobacteriota bacterium]